jgi:hypothetical protein
MIVLSLSLARVIILLGFFLLTVFCIFLAGLLAFSGYTVFLLGSTKGALACWAAACCPLVLVGLLGASLPAWLRRRAPAPKPEEPPESTAGRLLTKALKPPRRRAPPASTPTGLTP